MGLSAKNLSAILTQLEDQVASEVSELAEDDFMEVAREAVMFAFELSAKFTGSYSSSWRLILGPNDAPRFSPNLRAKNTEVMRDYRQGKQVISDTNYQLARAALLQSTRKSKLRARIKKLGGTPYQFFIVNVDPDFWAIQDNKDNLIDGPEGAPLEVLAQTLRFISRRVDTYGFR